MKNLGMNMDISVCGNVSQLPPSSKPHDTNIQVLDDLEEMGFVQPFNRPLLVNQTACDYPEISSPTLTEKQFTGKEMIGRWYQVRSDMVW